MLDDDLIQRGAWEAEVQARLQKQLDIPVLSNPAIVLCRKAMERCVRETMNELHLHLPGEEYDPNEEKLGPEEIRTGVLAGIKDSYRAYRKAMPPLTGAGNIRDFIACVAHGMLMDVFQPAESTKLLYAAQLAASAEVKRTRSQFD